MADIIIGTKNRNKIKEIALLLSGLPVNIVSGIEVPYVKEDGNTFKENAVKKAAGIADALGYITIADDSGLEVDALGGRPGVYSSRFSGENAADRDNNRKLLGLLKDVPYKKRGAAFKCAIAIAVPWGKVDVVSGICAGTISLTERGTGGFGYDPLFIPSGYDKTFAELGISVKNRISHRARALKKARLALEKIISMPGIYPRA